MSVRLRQQACTVTAWVALLFVLLVTLFAPAPGAHADVENFTYDSWHSEYFITQDNEGRARVTVRETVVAEFPEHDQNKGMVRGLPLTYQGAPSQPENVRVTDEHGDNVPYFTETDNDFYVILTGDDTYVHGQQTYVFEYEIPDIVFEPDNSSAQEFYWDLVPISHEQSIRDFRAVVVVDASLTAQLTDTTSCYQGSEANTDTCTVFREDDAQFTVGPTPLDAHETVTVALEFEPNTVTQPPQRIPNVFLDVVPMGLAALGAISVAVGLLAIAQSKRRSRETGKATIAQYDMPTYLPPLLISQFEQKYQARGVTAQLLHLAIHGLFRIEDQKNKHGQYPKKPKPVLTRTPTQTTAEQHEALDPLDVEAYTQLFPDNAQTLEPTKRSSGFLATSQKMLKQGKQAVYDRGYVVNLGNSSARLMGLIGIGLALVSVCIAIVALSMQRQTGLVPVAMLLSAAVLGFGIVCLIRHRHFTPEGAEVWQYAQGVKLFISVAEQDRIATLQSYTGALRAQVDSGEVVQLYERLLPYAVVFGKENSWGEVLAAQYSHAGVTGPAWYPTLGVQGLSSLQSNIAGFSQAVSQAASTSSSSSGAGGGGFAGGGGGGGFAGGR